MRRDDDVVIPAALAGAVLGLLLRADAAHAFGTCEDTMGPGEKACRTCTAMEQFSQACMGEPVHWPYPAEPLGQDVEDA